MSVSLNRGYLMGALAEDATELGNGIVRLAVHCAKYIKDVGESYTEPMVLFVLPYSKGKNKGLAMDIKHFTAGKPIFLEYALIADRKGNATPVVMPSNCHLAYPVIQEQGRPRTAEAAEEDDGSNSEVPF